MLDMDSLFKAQLAIAVKRSDAYQQGYEAAWREYRMLKSAGLTEAEIAKMAEEAATHSGHGGAA